jgi:hypothetical protein
MLDRNEVTAQSAHYCHRGILEKASGEYRGMAASVSSTGYNLRTTPLVKCAMDFEVSVAESGKYLVCRIQAPVTVDMTHRMAIAMNDLADRTGIDGRLIDVRGQRNTMSIMANYDLAYKDLDALEIDRSTKVASLVDSDEPIQDFVHNAIRNAGFNLRVFYDEAAAIAWLEADDI